MRLLRFSPLIVATLFSAGFVICYVSIARSLVKAGLETNGASFQRVCYDLRSDINVVVWRPFPQFEAWATSGWKLFHYGDAPEGTKAIVYFPSWYLFVPIAGLWVGVFVSMAPALGRSRAHQLQSIVLLASRVL